MKLAIMQPYLFPCCETDIIYNIIKFINDE